MKTKIDELLDLPEVQETYAGESRALARGLMHILLNTKDRFIACITQDDQYWLWTPESDWEPCFVIDDKELGDRITKKSGYHKFDGKFIDCSGNVQCLYREHYVHPETGETIHPMFVLLMGKLSPIPKSERINNIQHGLLMARAMRYAPESFQKMMDEKLNEIGLMPAATGYKEDGTPVCSLKNIAEKFGITEEKALEFAQEFEKRTGESLIVSNVSVHRKH